MSFLNLQHIKDPRTINQNLDGSVKTDEEKRSQRILTHEEEDSLVKYLVNHNSASHGLSDTQVDGGGAKCSLS